MEELDIVLLPNAYFESVIYDRDADSWRFLFESNINFHTQTLWRLIQGEKLKLISNDHGHQFGLPKPLDVQQELTELLKGSRLLKVIIKKNIADVLLMLTNNLQLEIFISSGGYESYSISIEGKIYVGMGMGEIAIFGS